MYCQEHMNDQNNKTPAEQFRDRLVGALLQQGVETSAAAVAREFNRRAPQLRVTPHAVRKWLIGETIPVHQRLLVLASWLGISAQWLAFGDTDPAAPPASPTQPELGSSERDFLANLGQLGDGEKEVIRELVRLIQKRQRK